jgi:subtilisin family serine protease
MTLFRIVSVCCMVGLLALAASSPVAAQEHVGTGVRAAVTNGASVRVVVALQPPSALQKSAEPRAAVRRQVQAMQADVRAAVPGDAFTVTRAYTWVPALAGVLTSTRALDRLAQHPAVRRIDRDVGGSGGLASSVPLIRADRWHENGVTGAGITAAVLDTGVDTDHPALSDDLVHQACFLDVNGVGQCPDGTDRQTGPGAAEDDNGHGTHVTGIITSSGTGAPRGVAPDVKFAAIKVLNARNRFARFSEIVAALDHLIDRPELGVDVVNMSLGTNRQFSTVCDPTTAYNMAGAEAVDMLRARGVVPVASAMNEGAASSLASPACLRSVISVGATTDDDALADFSNTSAFLDLVAPGVGIQSTRLGGGTVPFSGTSQAAPHAAGCAALLRAAGTDTMAAAIEASLETSTVQVADPTTGRRFPRLDCYTARVTAAVQSVQAESAVASGASVAQPPFVLRWETVRERDSRAFIVERRAGPPLPPGPPSDAGWTQVGRVDSQAPGGASTDTLQYRFEGTVPAPGQYTLRVRHRTQGGPETLDPVVAQTTLDVPLGGAFAIGGPQPNPSRGRATIEVVVADQQPVRVALYDLLGRRVQVLYDDVLPARQPLQLRTGPQALTSGTYIVRIVGTAFTDTRTMVVVR